MQYECYYFICTRSGCKIFRGTDCVKLISLDRAFPIMGTKISCITAFASAGIWNAKGVSAQP